MSEFIFLYRRPSTPNPNLSPKPPEERMRQWQAWVDKLETGGHMVSIGQPLADTGGGVVHDGKGTVTAGPYAETKDVVIGYSVVSAKDFAEAVQLTQGLPILDDGGTVEVRPVLRM